MSVLAVVLGRAGSKGLPGKNWLPLAGRPMVCHAVQHALDAKVVDRVVVTTDGPEIANAVREMNVEIVMRPAELADDYATVDAAVRHAVEVIASDASIVVLLYANVPVRPTWLIDTAVRTLEKTGADSVQSYSDVGKHHPYWMVTLNDEGRTAPHHPNTVYRRQDLPELYLPDGGVIAVTRENLFTVQPDQPHAFLGKDRRGVVVEAGEVVDVDSAIDCAVAEAILLQRSGTEDE